VIAPLRLRALAMLIGLGALLGGLGALIGGVVGLVRAGALRRLGGTAAAQAAGTRLQSSIEQRADRFVSGGDDHPPKPSARTRVALEALSLATRLRQRNYRPPVWRVLGLRKVDVRTGGPVTVRSTLIAMAVQRMRKEALNRAFAPAKRRARERQAAAAPRVQTALREHHGDPEAQQDAVRAIYQEDGIRPYATARWVALYIAATTLTDVPSLWLTGRSLPDLLAGTGVVVEDR